MHRPWAEQDDDEDEERGEVGVDSVGMSEGEYETGPDYEEVDTYVEKRKTKRKEGVRPPRLDPCASRRSRLDKPSTQRRVSRSRDSSSRGSFVVGRGSLAGSSDCNSVLGRVERDLYRVRSKGEHENTWSGGSRLAAVVVGSSTSATSLLMRLTAGLTHRVAQSPCCKTGPA